MGVGNRAPREARGAARGNFHDAYHIESAKPPMAQSARTEATFGFTLAQRLTFSATALLFDAGPSSLATSSKGDFNCSIASLC